MIRYNNKTVKMLRLGDDIVPKAIYGGIKVYNSPGIYVEPSTKILAHLTLSDGSIVDIEDDGTGVLKYSMASAYSTTCVSAEILSGCTSTEPYDMGYGVFSEFRILSSVTIPDSVTSIGGWTFFGCSSLTSVTIPDSVTSIGNGAFMECTGLTSVNIPSGVTIIEGETFYNCSSLTSFTIPNNITSIGGGAFMECYGLTEITIPSGVTYIGDGAFQLCSGLTEINIEAITPPTLDSDRAFFDTNDCPIYVPCESVEAYKTASIWKYIEYRIQCKETPVYGGKARLTLSNGSIVEIPGNGSLARSEVASYSASTTSVEIGSGCTDLSNGVFTQFRILRTVDMSNATNIRDIQTYAFAECQYLSAVTLPASASYAYFNTLGESAFLNCTRLRTIDIPDYIKSVGTTCFEGCTRLSSVTFGTGITSLYKSAFQGCTGLKTLTIKATTPPSIRSQVFEGVTLTGIYVPAESVDTYKTNTYWSTYASIIQPIT